MMNLSPFLADWVLYFIEISHFCHENPDVEDM